MKTLLAILKLLPVILEAIRALESAIPLPGQGKNYVVDPFMLQCAP